MRILLSRSKRRSSRTGLFATDSSRHCGTTMPAFPASVRDKASQATVFTSSPLFGNFAIARCPSRSRTDAFGRAPPSDEPGANRSFRSSSLCPKQTLVGRRVKRAGAEFQRRFE